MVDKTLSKIIGAGGGVATGDIIQSGRSVTEDGRNLLQLGMEGRGLTATETSANPVLASVLNERLVKDKHTVSAGNISYTYPFSVLKCLQAGEGGVAYLIQNNPASPEGVTVIRERLADGGSNVLTDANARVLDLDCSGDGAVLAISYKDLSTSRAMAAISTDYGENFTVVTLDSLSSSNWFSTVTVSADGTTVSILTFKGTSPNASSLKLHQVLDTSLPIVLDVSEVLTLPIVPSQLTNMSISDKGDCIGLYSYINPPISGFIHYYYSNDKGTTFTEINPPESDNLVDNSYVGRITVDRFTSGLLVVNAGKESAVSYSIDGGLTFLPVATPKDYKSTDVDILVSAVLDATKPAWPQGSSRAIVLASNHLVIMGSDNRANLYYLGNAVEYLGNLTTHALGEEDVFIGASFNAAKTQMSYGYTSKNTSSSVTPHYLHGTLKMAKYLPPAGTLTGLKIVGDSA